MIMIHTECAVVTNASLSIGSITPHNRAEKHGSVVSKSPHYEPSLFDLKEKFKEEVQLKADSFFVLVA